MNDNGDSSGVESLAKTNRHNTAAAAASPIKASEAVSVKNDQSVGYCDESTNHFS